MGQDAASHLEVFPTSHQGRGLAARFSFHFTSSTSSTRGSGTTSILPILPLTLYTFFLRLAICLLTGCITE